ncbi:MAG: hypothetical protein CFK52_06080 [Chloracidobacterium sp. CP2_5A]|nr:MAG: hypothetical protein CFK52_06080 [Chloracidobacterium sp. CP2_5A]
MLQLCVVVTDQGGRPVTSLKKEGFKKEDFALRESGKPQEIAFFRSDERARRAPREGQASAEAPPQPPAAAEGRNCALVVDDLRLAPGNRAPLKPALLKFIDETLVEGGRLLVMPTSGTLGFLQQMTDDKRVRRAAVERLTPAPLALAQAVLCFKPR